MKILEIITSMDIGGAETHVLELCLELKRLGHEVTLVSDKGVYIQKIKDAGIRYVFAPFSKRDPISFKNANIILQKELFNGYDAIHAHTRYTLFILSFLKLRHKAPPIIGTCHLCFSLGLKRSFSYWGDVTLAVSEDIKGYLVREYGIDSEKIIITSNGVDTEKFLPAKKEKIILNVSRFDKDRSLCALLLCEIAPELLKRSKDYRIALIGDGDDAQRLKRAVMTANERLGYEGVIYKGKSQETEKEYAKARIFAGVSRAAIEAMSCECATVLCGNEGYFGILEENNFYDALATNLCARRTKEATANSLLKDLSRLAENNELTDSLGKKMRELVKLNLSRENMARDLLRAIELAKTNGRMKKGLIVGYFGHGNMGDEATLEILKQRLSELGFDAPLAVLHAPHGVLDLQEFNRSFTRKLNECDTVIFGGGSLLQNETSNRSLFYYLEIIRRAKRAKKRVILIGSGIGKITGDIAKARCALGLKQCDLVSLRTYKDLSVFEQLTQKKADCLMPDLCFCLECIQKQKEENYILYIPKEHNGTLVEQIKEKSRLLGLKIVVLSLFDAEDLPVAKKAAYELNAELYSPHTLIDTLAVIRNAAFVITERLHGAIFALTQKVEVFIDTSVEKSDFLYDSVKQTAKSLCIPCPIHRLSDLKAKKIGAATDSDFEKLLLFFRSKINFAFEIIKDKFD